MHRSIAPTCRAARHAESSQEPLGTTHAPSIDHRERHVRCTPFGVTSGAKPVPRPTRLGRSPALKGAGGCGSVSGRKRDRTTLGARECHISGIARTPETARKHPRKQAENSACAFALSSRRILLQPTRCRKILPEVGISFDAVPATCHNENSE